MCFIVALIFPSSGRRFWQRPSSGVFILVSLCTASAASSSAAERGSETPAEIRQPSFDQCPCLFGKFAEFCHPFSGPFSSIRIIEFGLQEALPAQLSPQPHPAGLRHDGIVAPFAIDGAMNGPHFPRVH